MCYIDTRLPSFLLFLKKKDIFPIKDELFLYIGCKDVAGSFK